MTPFDPVLDRGYTRCRFGLLHYRKAGPIGPVGGPPLILLHQNPSSSLEYAKFAAEMAKDRLVVAFDTPGYGMSDRPLEPPGLEGYAAAFAEGLDNMGLGKDQTLDVFGFHTGTYLSVELALLRPDLIGRMILSGIPFRPADQRATRLEAALNPAVLTEDGKDVVGYQKKMWDFTVGGRHPDTPLDQVIEIYIERLRPMHRTAWPYIGVWSYEPEKRLPMVKQPVLVLQPHEPLLDHSRNAAALMPGAKLVEFPHLDKDVFEWGVDDFAREIRAWKA
jgi:pimeloyl-ACP methyl ester carboxylesterase